MAAEAHKSTWIKRLSLTLVGLVFTAWIVGRLLKGIVPTDASAQPAGFAQGFIHGILMPAAMPRLLLGQDIPIYAMHNTGHAYKVGYTIGVNLCGAVFFGLLYWRLHKHFASKRRAANLTQCALPGTVALRSDSSDFVTERLDSA